MADTMPLWERRFRTPVVTLPEWSPRAPDRLTFASNESGVWQLSALDLTTGGRRRVTGHPVGVTDGTPTLDGSGVVWFQDETGDESGRWFVQPFDGGPSRPFVEGVSYGWNEGLAQAPGVVVVVVSDRDGFRVHVSSDGAPAEVVMHSDESITLAEPQFAGRGFTRSALSADGALLCVEHSEHGDLVHPALRVLDTRTGEVVADLHDPGLSLHASCWSPLPGDARLAITHERAGEERPAIWDLRTGEVVDVPVGASAGVVAAEDWWPDASALLLANLTGGVTQLLRHDVRTGEAGPIDAPEGQIAKARVRPDGRVWMVHARGDRPPQVVDDTGRDVVTIEGRTDPPAHGYQPWSFANEHGQTVHGFHVDPPGDAPHPVMLFVHGGPTSLDMQRWQPEVQAYVDAGFVVGLVNYRGSIGYGREWRDALHANVGGPELEDVNAGLRDLVARGIADPTRAVIAGWSWGGYISLLELGKHPDLWRCGVAGVPVGDYPASYDDSSPLLQAYDRALLGATPHELPELMRERNPIEFVEGVRAPVLIIAGEHDSRCPIRQVRNYVARLEELGKPHETYFFGTGHGSLDVEERVRQVGVILDFLRRNVPS